MKKKIFFEPFVGKGYEEGINGKKVLVLGTSFYCPHTELPCHDKCTDSKTKDSSAFDTTCPIYKEDGLCLHKEPSNSILDMPDTYQRFANGMAKYLHTDDYHEIWSRMAFTNYIQYMLSADSGGYRETRISDISERDLSAFYEVLQNLQPDIVIVWGCVINSSVIKNNPYIVDREELKATDWYVCHIRPNGCDKDIAVINTYHPSSSAWYSAMNDFEKHFTNLLNS